MSERIYIYEPLWGSWEVDKFLGAGSFGRVYRIKRVDFGETFYAAAKIISIPQSDSEVRSAFAKGLDEDSVKSYFSYYVRDILQEVRFMNDFKGNTNIVSIEDYQAFEHKEKIGWDIIIRMELLLNFFDYISDNDISRHTVIKLGIDICKALELCQAKYLIHRDIKPDNIFVSSHGDFKIGDFGIARQVERTSSGLSKRGTLNYIAPEIYKGEPYNASVDIYSLGLVLYRLLNCNRAPFLPLPPEVITPINEETARSLRINGEQLPAPVMADQRLAEVVLKACAYNPRERFSSPVEMRENLEAISDPELDANVVLPRMKNRDKVTTSLPDKKLTESVFTQIPSDIPERRIGTGIITGHTTGQDLYSHDRTGKVDTNKDNKAALPEVGSERIDAGKELQEKTTTQKVPRRDTYKKFWLIAAAIFTVLIIGVGVMWAFINNENNELTKPVKNIELNSESLTLLVEDTQQLAYEITPTDAEDKSVVWSSNNTEVATVDVDGVVTAVGVGSAVITVKTNDGNKTASLTVTVTNKVIAVASIGLNKEETAILVGESEQLTHIIEPADATNNKVTWKSSNEKVATVDEQGYVMAVAVGTATVTATTEEGNKTASCIVSVSEKAVAPTGVKLNKTSLTLKVGTTEVLIATIAPADATNQNLTWSTSDSSVVKIGPEGKVTALKRGTATISVNTDEGNFAANCKVTVTQPVISVSLDNTNITLNNGSSVTLTAKVNPGDADNRKVTWSSSNTNVATVDSSGKVTAKGKGEAKITVKTEDGGKTASCLVTVEQPPTSIGLNITSIVLSINQTETLTAIVKPDNSNNKSVTWSSSNSAVATVDANGTVTAKAFGTATIMATTVAGGLSGTCTVTVEQLPTSVTLNKPNATLYVGETDTLTAAIKPDNANNKSVTWSSSNSAVASVDANGKITAKGSGTATIVATTVVGGLKATCTVTVEQPPTSVTLNKSSTTLYVGETETLTVTVKPDNANNKSVTWSSSNSAVASVDANGRITAKGAGKATITATTNVAGKTASCSVTVKPLTKAIFIGSGQYGNFGMDLNNYYTAGDKTTIYQFEFYTSGTVPTNGHLFSYNKDTHSGMTIYFNSEKKLSVRMDYNGSKGLINCSTTTFLPNSKYNVRVNVTYPKQPVITINGVTQSITKSGTVGWSLNQAIKYLGSPTAAQASNVYITSLYICGTPPGNSVALKTFSANMSSYGVGTTSISSGGVTLNLTGTSVKEYKLP